MVKLAYWKSSGVALGTGLRLPQQLRQLGKVCRDPPRRVARKQLGRRSPEGKRTGNYQHGARSRETIELLKLIKSLRCMAPAWIM
jgi:hypothetical protein